ncbi:Alpha/beta hydrolase family protein [Novipirellula galeiformis]|uniref:Alpha/beta hydrolase family protein n=1 Tax=Novipirellula galeiformis TaxID=2528004 RepID=A0A5C6CS57_9BACT|nr:hypothetical protein [Novipirellula galeiformis]TWU26261.1 Alpha/beta hydrolase family protein [Novipirellula galeiformis]
MYSPTSCLGKLSSATAVIVSMFLAATPTLAENNTPLPQSLPNTQPLELNEPLDEFMVRGINRFADRELSRSSEMREQNWQRDFSSLANYQRSISDHRNRFQEIIGAVEPRVDATGFEMIVTQKDFQSGLPILASSAECTVREVRWPVLDGVTGEGLLLSPAGRESVASVVAIPDADWSPEAFVGLSEGADAVELALALVQQGCEVLIPTLINRDDEFSGNPSVAYTNLPHREFVYRTSFEIGRHVIGYEVQKVRAAIDNFVVQDVANQVTRPIGVVGVGEGGLLAFYTAAIDTRVDSTMVCGYFDDREALWREPIYRNVWSLLTEFADADIASLIAPRRLTIEACRAPQVDGPPKVRPGRRNAAAPGRIKTPALDAVREEFGRAQTHYRSLKHEAQIQLVISGDGHGPAASDAAVESLLSGVKLNASPAKPEKLRQHRELPDASARQARQLNELIERNQHLVRLSPKIREKHWKNANRSNVTSWLKTAQSYRDEFYDEVIGRLPTPTMPLNPRSRLIIEEDQFTVYEVMLDVFPDVVAGGYLLLPTDLKPGERRPVVVCQHGLEGTPAWTLEQHTDLFLKRGFAAELAMRGFIVYSPQSPFRGHDEFRAIQLKSNPLKRSLFSYIIPQHARTLEWLSTLPHVDPQRIGFYGISYGGKTAMRVPPFVPGYALSICSADFNDWIAKTTSNVFTSSYVFVGEYEIWEWNMGNVSSYAELACMMTPRPFMVERGHRDGVGPDEWVAMEYSKVRRHYDEIGLGDLTEIEFFNGPHTIRGLGTFSFLHKHLNWPEPK